MAKLGFALAAVVAASAACAGGQERAPRAGGASAAASSDGASSSSTSPSSSTRATAKADGYEPAETPGDAIGPWVRRDRSSRLGLPMPRGTGREAWSAALERAVDPIYVVASGARIGVVGRGSRFSLYDTKGTPAGAGTIEGEPVFVDAAMGCLFTSAARGERTFKSFGDGGDCDAPRAGSADAPLASVADVDRVRRSAQYKSASVYPVANGIELRDAEGVRPIIQGTFEALDLAVDDGGVVHALVRQKGELALWSTPVSGGSVGRVKLDATRRDRSTVPPVLGKSLHAVVLDDRMIAVGLDGKKLWERRGAFTGGVTITSDDRVLVADGPHVYAIDPTGRIAELVHVAQVVFVTPPVLVANGLLVVASGQRLHAFAF